MLQGNREYWIIYRVPGFLAVVWFVPPPPVSFSVFLCVAHRVHILVEMKQGQCICPLSWSVHCNFTGEGKFNERGWACTPPPPYQPGPILPSSLNVPVELTDGRGGGRGWGRESLVLYNNSILFAGNWSGTFTTSGPCHSRSWWWLSSFTQGNSQLRHLK